MGLFRDRQSITGQLAAALQGVSVKLFSGFTVLPCLPFDIRSAPKRAIAE
jgi:hypothetical protein